MFIKIPAGTCPQRKATAARNGGTGTAGGRQIITGHIDFLQIRNGSVHILDYKPNASKERPIGQLTVYALALSRLTGLRLFDFKCAWFDDKNYYEFFPLHVVYKRHKIKITKDQTRLNQIKIGSEELQGQNLNGRQ
ncbi:MAG: PD-(D/E)XK nuclease family protein [Candidatus Aenigmarchaeota archaeon]|nr:PD-(D/E)XK nuclease family protein [Candidatus Aenigmarchaeota archaeon]